MVEKKIKVLAVCPYAGLDNIIKEVVTEFPQIEMFYEYGELSGGAEIALQYANGEVDAFISRGGTAKQISRITKLPTFDIGISANDLINTLSLTRSTKSTKICIVGFHEVTQTARFLDRLLERPIPIHVTSTAEQNLALMKKLKQENYELVIGDATSVRFARDEGINNIMITSGEDSVRSCLHQVLQLFEMCDECRQLVALQRNLLKNLETSYFIIGSNLQVLHSQINGGDLSKVSSGVMQEVSAAYVKKFKQNEFNDSRPFEHGGSAWVLECKEDLFRGESVTLVVWRRISAVDSKTKMLLQDLSDAQYPFQVESLNAKDPKMEQAIADCRVFAQRNAPILIYGEPFTGRQALAHMLYNLSSFAKGGFYSLDAMKLSEDNLRQFFAGSSSYLANMSLTLLVRNLQRTDKEICKLFLKYIEDSGFCRHSRLICIFDEYVDRADQAQVELTRYLISSLGTLLITVPSLRERGDLSLLATIALGEACGLCGRVCGGFTAQAQQFIEEYPWYGNLHELRHIIRQVTEGLEHEYIDVEDLKKALGKWGTLYKNSEHADSAPVFAGTLAEIEKQVITSVLMEEHGNRSKVIKRLGISRNTLWRKLKEYGLEG